uniref:Ska2 N-terminal domain-containing protein n=1 Tax=Fundulus heteroclitus TaxID=8078 RepID=A0A3Q2PI68_FUNHE
AEFLSSAPLPPGPEDVTVMLENLKSIKAKHSVLRSQVSKITDAQKESMEFIKNRLNSATELIKHCQQTSDLEVPLQGESSALLMALQQSLIPSKHEATVDRKLPLNGKEKPPAESGSASINWG